VLFAGTASATTLRVIVVQTTMVAGYVKSLQKARQCSRRREATGTIRAWVAHSRVRGGPASSFRFEYPSLEPLAKDTAMMKEPMRNSRPGCEARHDAQDRVG